MTDKEKAIVMAYTGICMLTGKKFQIFHKYVEDIMNRPIMTHEIGCLADEIKEKSQADFIALCANESSSENPNKSETSTGSTTKNDLGVDLISRTEVLKLIYDYKENHSENRNEYPINYGTLLDIIRWVRNLPSVTPQEPIHRKCNQCKYYDGVHNVQGHAPCSYHKIGGVMWNWYCSQFESEVEE